MKHLHSKFIFAFKVCCILNSVSIVNRINLVASSTPKNKLSQCFGFLTNVLKAVCFREYWTSDSFDFEGMHSWANPVTLWNFTLHLLAISFNFIIFFVKCFLLLCCYCLQFLGTCNCIQLLGVRYFGFLFDVVYFLCRMLGSK